jgi:hypothetical protein
MDFDENLDLSRPREKYLTTFADNAFFKYKEAQKRGQCAVVGGRGRAACR